MHVHVACSSRGALGDLHFIEPHMPTVPTVCTLSADRCQAARKQIKSDELCVHATQGAYIFAHSDSA